MGKTPEENPSPNLPMWSYQRVSISRKGLVIIYKFEFTRSSGHYAPFLLAPVEGWGPFGPPRALRPPVGFQCPNLELKTLNLRNFDCNFALFGGKIWLWLFYNLFCVMVLKFYTKNLKSFQAKIKPWHWFSRFKIKSKFGKITVTPSFLLKTTWDFFVEFWNHNAKKL